MMSVNSRLRCNLHGLMTNQPPRISVLHEDNHLLVVNKPAGIATMGTEAPTMHSMACDYLREKYNKPGNVFVGIVSRLDTMTSGTLVMARTSKAAARLTKQFASTGEDSSVKIYLAILEGRFEQDAARIKNHVWKDDKAKRMRVVPADHSGGKPATTDFVTLAATPECSLVAARIRTGRKHQIRVQFAHLGNPVWGDRKYRGRQAFPEGIALHSWRLRITHPTLKEHGWYTSAPPPIWSSWLKRLNISVDHSLWSRVSKELS